MMALKNSCVKILSSTTTTLPMEIITVILFFLVLVSTWPAGTNSNAASVFVSGSDVYVAGVVNNVATLWKNGVATSLSEGASSSTSVFVSGSDVYVAGEVDNVATLWKNGAPASLPAGAYAHPKSVFVSGSDVYICGPNGFGAVLWKNGVATALTDATYASSVFVTN